ncbi:MAG: CPBP family intramembrane metalloprotease [Bacilli bacterium]|nr:CPBP family intramembrane metalloprotease [Bacilli bacterium]
MKTYFHHIACPECGKGNDSKRTSCVHCKADLNNRDAKKFEQQLIVPFWKEIVFFLLALFGLSAIATVVQSIQLSMVMGQNPELSLQEAAKVVSSGGYILFLEFFAYGMVFLGAGTLLWSSWKDIGKSLANWKPYLMGIAGLAVIMAFEMSYNMVTSMILKAAGIEPASNNNQSAIVTIVSMAPFLSVIVFGFIGPFVEELAYRVGLFGFLSRINKVFAYVGVPLVFGLIHFDFGAGFDFANVSSCVNEWVNLPIYMFSGLVFSFLYDKFGFGASLVAHTANNVFSISMIIIQNAVGGNA